MSCGKMGIALIERSEKAVPGRRCRRSRLDPRRSLGTGRTPLFRVVDGQPVLPTTLNGHRSVSSGGVRVLRSVSGTVPSITRRGTQRCRRHVGHTVAWAMSRTGPVRPHLRGSPVGKRPLPLQVTHCSHPVTVTLMSRSAMTRALVWRSAVGRFRRAWSAIWMRRAVRFSWSALVACHRRVVDGGFV